MSAVALVALGATHQAIGPGTSTGRLQSSPVSGSRPAQSENTDLCDALRARFPLQPHNQREDHPCLAPGHTVLFIIATAPNPANSQLALSFDRTVESIERAAGDRGFLFDRFVFPWDAEPQHQSDPEKKRTEEKRRSESEGKPGMLLFRGHFDVHDPMHRFEALAVMLVPENPSSGVNGDAFKAAATFARENSPNERTLAILGPSFSSSAVSLQNAMQNTPLQYVIRTGSATVPEAWKLLEGETGSFAATVRDDDQASQALFKHLDLMGEWRKQGRVAILSESGTLYGSHASSSRQSSNRLNLVFPRGISWLRNAYQDMPAAATPNLSPAIPSPIARLLPFAISEPSYGDDKTPSLSAAQTPISQEAALLSIANTLRRERVRFAVISSTDPLDNIFLIRFLRTHCPDLRIITFESDLLYVRAATEFPATGVILVTTYPLFLQNQVWSSYGSSENRVPFVSMASEGTYNALRSLLIFSAGAAFAKEDSPLDYKMPFDSATRKPPVWLTVTTPGGYWPLAVLDDNDLRQNEESKLLYSWPVESGKKAAEAGKDAPVIEGVSRLWYSLAFGLVSTCSLLLLALSGRLNCSNLPLLCSFAYQFPQDENAFGRAFFRTVVFLCLSMLCWLLSWPVIVLRGNGPSWGGLSVAVLLVTIGIGVLVTSAHDVIKQQAAPAAARKRQYWNMLIVAIALTVFWLENWRQTFYGGQHHEGFFAAYRSLDLVNGVAPTIPFALLVFALISWAWIHLRRLRMLAAEPRSVPSLGTQFLERTRAAALVVQIDRVTDAVQNPFLFPMWVYAAGLTAVATLYVVTSEYTQSVELRPFDVLYGVAFSVVVLLLVLTCGRMVLIWTRLRAVLRTIDLHPVRSAFETTPLADSWGPILHRGIDLDHLERRYRELLGTSVAESAPAISDSAMEKVRAEILDPAWEQRDLDSARFKTNAELFALRYVAFIQANCRQIENLLIFLPIGFVLTLLSLNSYPFQSGHVLSWFMANLLIAMGMAVVFVLANSERDPVLSRLNGTSPGKIGKDFYMNLISYGALPVLTVLAAQFPAIGSFLFSWVQPLLQALRG